MNWLHILTNMKSFKFFLVSYRRTKTVCFRAENSVKAREIIARDYPEWGVSMFWNEWPEK